MNRLRVVHVTEFTYDEPVSESYNELRLQPQDDNSQSCISFRLQTLPTSSPASHRDYFGNWVHRFNVLPPHRRLRVDAQSVVMLRDSPAPSDLDLSLVELDRRRAALREEHWDILVPTLYVPLGDTLAPLVHEVEAASGGTVAGYARAAAQVVHDRFRYERGATHVHSSVEDVVGAGAGVCQDFAHLLLCLARLRGIPARYVSGYLLARTSDGSRSEFEDVVGAQASHAWTEVYVPDGGWLSIDPTLGEPVMGNHLRIACGRDYGDVPPVRGVYRGQAGQQMVVDVRVRPALDANGCEHLARTASDRRGTVPAATRGPADQ